MKVGELERGAVDEPAVDGIDREAQRMGKPRRAERDGMIVVAVHENAVLAHAP